MSAFAITRDQSNVIMLDVSLVLSLQSYMLNHPLYSSSTSESVCLQKRVRRNLRGFFTKGSDLLLAVARPLQAYFIINYRIYQSPDMYTVLSNRLARYPSHNTVFP